MKICNLRNGNMSLSVGTRDLRFLGDFFCKSSVFFCFSVFCFCFFFSMIRMKSNPLVSGFSLTSLMSLLITLSVNYFCRFQPCKGIMWHQNRSEMWSNAKIQKWQILIVEFTSFDSFISECSIWSRKFWSILRSSLQSWDIRFFRGDLRVFDCFGNTHWEAQIC